MKFLHASLVCLGLLGSGEQAIHIVEPGWYCLQPEDGQKIILKVSATADKRLVCTYQGVTLEVRSSEIQSLLPLEEYRKKHPLKINLPVDQEKQIRDRIEELGRRKTASVSTIYSLLARQFPECRPIVHEALKHSSTRVRRVLLKLLGEFGEAESDLDAVKTLLVDSKPTVRLAALMALRRFGPEALDPLVDFIKQESSAKYRRAAVRTLVKWNDDRAVQHLIEILAAESDEDVRSTIVSALTKFTGLKLGDDARVWKQVMDQKNGEGR